MNLILGSKSSKYLRWWCFIIVIGILVGAYWGLKRVPSGALAYIKGGWAVFGAGVTAFLWSTTMTKMPLFKNPLCIIGVFVVFASTLIYVSASTFEQSLFKWSLPVGFLLGIVSARFSGQEEKTMDSDASVGGG